MQPKASKLDGQLKWMKTHTRHATPIDNTEDLTLLALFLQLLGWQLELCYWMFLLGWLCEPR